MDKSCLSVKTIHLLKLGLGTFLCQPSLIPRFLSLCRSFALDRHDLSVHVDGRTIGSFGGWLCVLRLLRNDVGTNSRRGTYFFIQTGDPSGELLQC